ncbi:MAG TPA: sulfite exporter TauE/SafE family protein [Polyangiaceae bacterium]|jgi:hypothetical protein|nr:sulfite exporter TauE/SafE family protein [Polyangiaceae bacterium]
MTQALFLAVFVASLLGSVHCVAMCGPFVAVYSGLGSQAKSPFAAHIAYQLGRLVSYSLLGLAAGAVGNALDLAGGAAGIARVSALLAGGVMALWGLLGMLESQGVRARPSAAPRALRALLGRALARLNAKPPLMRALTVGAATTLLPCGWLYAFAVTAAGTGSVRGAVSVMVAFWLGNVPLLLGFGIGVGALGAWLRRRSPAGALQRSGPLLSSSLLVAVGIATLIVRVNVPAFALRAAHPNAGPPSAADISCPLHEH